MRWVERYENDDTIKRCNRQSVSYKVKKDHVIFLLDEIKKNKTITMNELKFKLEEKFNINLSRFFILNLILLIY